MKGRRTLIFGFGCKHRLRETHYRGEDIGSMVAFSIPDNLGERALPQDILLFSFAK